MALYLASVEECLLAIKEGNFIFECPNEVKEALYCAIEKLRDDDDDYVVRCARFLYENKKYDAAFKIASKFAKKHNTHALYLMGLCYYYGCGVVKSIKKAHEYFEIAAKKGDPYSQSRLAALYFEGKGVEKDYGQAVYWYQKAAELDYPQAICRLAICYYFGHGVEKSAKQSFALFDRLIKKYGKEKLKYIKKLDFNTGVRFCLGCLYYYEDAGVQSYPEAVYWFKDAAEEGHVASCYHLAMCYCDGTGVKQSDKEAVKWLEKPGAKLGPRGSYMLAKYYETGKGVDKVNLKIAKKLYGKAFKRGKTEAIDDLRRVKELLKKEERESKSIKVPEEIDIFISWNHDNVDIKNNICAVLEGHGVRMWDSDKNAEGILTNDINYAIEHAKGYIILLTKEAFNSKWMPIEVEKMFSVIDDPSNEIKDTCIKAYVIGDSDEINHRIDELPEDNAFKRLKDLTEDFSLSGKKADIDKSLNNAIAFSQKVIREMTVIRYQEQLKETFNVFSPFLSDIPIEDKDRHVIPNLEFEKGYINRDLMDDGMHAYNPLNVLNIKEIVLIHGEGGSGKSLYIKNLLRDYSEDNNLFFYLPCSDIKKEIERSGDYDVISLIEKIAFNIAKYHGISKQTISNIFNNETRNFYIIFDALDEADEYKKDIIAMVNQIRSIRQNLHFIFTSRNKGDASLIIDITNLAVKPLSIKAMDDKDIIKLFDLIYRRNYGDDDKDSEESTQAALFKSHLPLMADDIKKNPLLMSNLICIYFATRKIQPQKSYILETSTDILINFLEKERGILNKINDIIKNRNIRLNDVIESIAFQFVVNENMTLEKAIINFNEHRREDKEIKENNGVMNDSEIETLCAYLRQRRIIVGNSFSHDIYLSFFASKYMFSLVYKTKNNRVLGFDQLMFIDDGKDNLDDYVQYYFSSHDYLWPNITLDFIGKLDYEVNYTDKDKKNTKQNELFDYSLTTIIDGMSENARTALEDIVSKETLFYRNQDIKDHLKR